MVEDQSIADFYLEQKLSLILIKEPKQWHNWHPHVPYFYQNISWKIPNFRKHTIVSKQLIMYTKCTENVDTYAQIVYAKFAILKCKCFSCGIQKTYFNKRGQHIFLVFPHLLLRAWYIINDVHKSANIACEILLSAQTDTCT